jgi:type I restriction enzyme, S subunit
MAIKFKSVNLTQVKSDDRFDPRYHLFAARLVEARNSYNFVRLQEVTDKIVAGKTHSSAKYIAEGPGTFPFIRTGDVKKYQLSKENLRYLDQSQTDELASSQLKPGDILISAIGNYLGSTCQIPNSIPLATFNQNSLRVRVNDSRISPEFLTYFLNSSFGQAQLESLHSRTGQKIVNAKVAGGLEVPILNNETFTQRIKNLEHLEVKALEKIARARLRLEDELGLISAPHNNAWAFQATKSSLSRESMWTPQYSRPKYIEMQNYIMSNFETFRIEEVADVFSGDEIGSENYIPYSERREGMKSFIRTTDIVNFQTDPFPDFYVEPSIVAELDQQLAFKDILFTNDGKIGQVAFITAEDQIVTQSHINAVRVLRKTNSEVEISPEYLFLCLTIPEIGLYQSERYTVIQSTIPTIADFFKTFYIPVVSPGLRNELTTDIAEAFDLKAQRLKEIFAIRNEIEELF